MKHRHLLPLPVTTTRIALLALPMAATLTSLIRVVRSRMGPPFTLTIQSRAKLLKNWQQRRRQRSGGHEAAYSVVRYERVSEDSRNSIGVTAGLAYQRPHAMQPGGADPAEASPSDRWAPFSCSESTHRAASRWRVTPRAPGFRLPGQAGNGATSSSRDRPGSGQLLPMARPDGAYRDRFHLLDVLCERSLAVRAGRSGPSERVRITFRVIWFTVLWAAARVSLRTRAQSVVPQLKTVPAL